MNPLLQVALCFGTGILSDILVTGYYIFVGRDWPWLAASVSIPIALMNFWVIDAVLLRGSAWHGALAYAAGNAVGCFAIMTGMRRWKK